MGMVHVLQSQMHRNTTKLCMLMEGQIRVVPLVQALLLHMATLMQD